MSGLDWSKSPPHLANGSNLSKRRFKSRYLSLGHRDWKVFKGSARCFRKKEKIPEKSISSENTFTLTGICPVIQLWAVGLDRTLTRVKNHFRKELPNDIHILKYIRQFRHF